MSCNASGLKSLANDLPVHPENLHAAVSLVSIAQAVVAFFNALFGDSLLQPASLVAMIRHGFDDYGYGVWTYAAW